METKVKRQSAGAVALAHTWTMTCQVYLRFPICSCNESCAAAVAVVRVRCALGVHVYLKSCGRGIVSLNDDSI